MAEPLSITPPTLSILGFAHKPHELWVQYELSNTTGHILWLFALLSDKWQQLKPPPREVVSAEICPTCFLPPQTVHFLQGIVPPPVIPGVSLYAPQRPYALKLAVGARCQVTFRAPLPLREFSQYNPPQLDGEDTNHVEVREMRLSLDYLVDAEKFFAEEVRQAPGTFQANGYPIRRLALDAPLDRPLDMIVLKTFPRFN